jgi:hypothetical protein
MKALRVTPFLLLLAATARGGEGDLKSTPLISSNLYKTQAEKQIVERIRAGAFDGNTVELCTDDLPKCDSDEFKRYKKVGDDGKTTYPLTIQQTDWEGLPRVVKGAVIRALAYFAYEYPSRESSKPEYAPIDVVMRRGLVWTSPLSLLSPNSGDRYLKFADPSSLIGGVGSNAYGPNCWYNAIAAIADYRAPYARGQLLARASWDRPRFMGAAEFRHHMRQFTEVKEPEFGDVIRYYTDDPVYDEDRDIYNGEVHAAVYIGREEYAGGEGKKTVHDIALTKNGRNDRNLLVFQDTRGLDWMYLKDPGGQNTPAGERIKKGYFRVKRGASLLDPGTVGRASDTHAAYQIDQRNYADRWLCLAKLIDPPGKDKDCYDYPGKDKWVTLPYSGSVLAPSVGEAKAPKARPAPLPKIERTIRQPSLRLKGSG